MRVLIIDDEEDTRSIFSMSLGLLGGAEVIEAQNGPAGIDVAARENPDVIILDLLMPGMDGSQTFLALKNRPDTSKIPVIFMTVKGMFSEFDRLKSMGALAVIAKPFDPTTLTQQIKNILTTNGFDPENQDNFAGESNDFSAVSNDFQAQANTSPNQANGSPTQLSSPPTQSSSFPAQSNSFQAQSRNFSVESKNLSAGAKNFSAELNNVAAESDPSAATGEMIIRGETNQPSGSVEVASIKRKSVSSAAKPRKSGRGVRGKISRPERIAQRIIAKRKPRKR
jgi:two-component system, OmpR family, response regulator